MEVKNLKNGTCINCAHASLDPDEPRSRAEWLRHPDRGRDGICPHKNNKLPRWVRCAVPNSRGNLLCAHRDYRCGLYRAAPPDKRLDRQPIPCEQPDAEQEELSV